MHSERTASTRQIFVSWLQKTAQPIHAVCGVFDESQKSIASMNWCYNCDEGCNAQDAHVAVDAKTTPNQTKLTTDHKKKEVTTLQPPQISRAHVPLLEPPLHPMPRNKLAGPLG